MQVQRVQNNNTTFSAKVNVIEKTFNKKFLNILSEKAKKIGHENDIVELEYNEFNQTFKARYITNGENKEHLKLKTTADSYKDLWEQQEQAALNYLDKLIKKYGNRGV